MCSVAGASLLGTARKICHNMSWCPVLETYCPVLSKLIYLTKITNLNIYKAALRKKEPDQKVVDSVPTNYSKGALWSQRFLQEC